MPWVQWVARYLLRSCLACCVVDIAVGRDTVTEMVNLYWPAAFAEDYWVEAILSVLLGAKSRKVTCVGFSPTLSTIVSHYVLILPLSTAHLKASHTSFLTAACSVSGLF